MADARRFFRSGCRPVRSGTGPGTLYPVCVLVLVASGFAATAGLAGEPSPHLVYPGLQDKPYAHVRHALSAAGLTPVPAVEPPDCPYDSTFCGYPELHSCFVDVPACVMTWKAKNGRLFRVDVDMAAGGANPRASLISEDDRK